MTKMPNVSMAVDHFTNLPQVVLMDWPFFIGFGLIEAGMGLVETMAPDQDNPMVELAQAAALSGAKTTLKFAYWDGFTNYETDGKTLRNPKG